MKASAPAAATRGLPAGLLRNAKPKLLFGFVVFSVAMPLCLAICAVNGFSLGAGLLVALVGSLGATLLSSPALKNPEQFRPDYASSVDSLKATGLPHDSTTAEVDSTAAAHVRAEAVRLART